jgi:RimJ/RimL family protein N-acetyltransferase
MLLTQRMRVMQGNQAFQLRCLEEGDVNQAWISWFADSDTQRFIAAARKPVTLESQRAYVRDTAASADSLVLGLLDEDGTLCATSGVQGVGAEYPKGPWMGCLVAPSRRGRGIGTLIASSVPRFLAEHCGCRQVFAGIDAHNARSVAAFAASGFQQMPDRDDGSLVWRWTQA